jgi:hypothetical protein
MFILSAEEDIKNGVKRNLYALDKLSFFYSDNFLNCMLVILQDELARVFVSLFDAKRLLYQLLWNMFSKEVTLFLAVYFDRDFKLMLTFF